MRSPVLLDQETVQINSPDWLPKSYRAFRRQVLDDGYPCYFATAGEKRGELRYTWTEEAGDPNLANTLGEFLELSTKNKKTRHALVAFLKPEDTVLAHDEYSEQFWRILQTLHDHDPKPWPKDQPRDPSDPEWEFCFGGVPMFVFAAAPSYQRRISRNLGPSMLLLFQPRSVFKGIEGGTPAGTKARQIIRDRLETWDLVPPHEAFGVYGNPSNFEIDQYLVPDDDRPVPKQKPLRIRGASGDGVAETAGVRIVHGQPHELDQVVRAMLPSSGSVEVRRDAPAQEHPWHSHPKDETLWILEGSMEFEALGRRARVIAGDRIELPAGLRHRSRAGHGGCGYVIKAAA